MEKECSALRDNMFFADPAGGKDKGLVEELLGEPPMVGGGPAADVALTEEHRDKYPGVCDDLFAACEIQGHRNIESVPDSS